ncbi:hypothetical protein IFR05_017353 [Cadophora sp. M221]|nr:hypothetical protein IFR05_017353 [Cadophora sp. M221]
MNESGVRVGCPSGESVIVPTEVKELYTASPQNRKSLKVLETIRGDGKKTLPPFIITPGEKIMENSRKRLGEPLLARKRSRRRLTDHTWRSWVIFKATRSVRHLTGNDSPKLTCRIPRRVWELGTRGLASIGIFPVTYSMPSLVELGATGQSLTQLTTQSCRNHYGIGRIIHWVSTAGPSRTFLQGPADQQKLTLALVVSRRLTEAVFPWR